MHYVNTLVVSVMYKQRIPSVLSCIIRNHVTYTQRTTRLPSFYVDQSVKIDHSM